MTYQILPSILSANMMRLGDEVQAVIDAGADMIHFDVMDNHYVPNLTFGPVICQQLHQQFKSIPIDVHLMTQPVDTLIEQFAGAGASRISIHADATTHLDRSLQLIKSLGCLAGIALNPATDIHDIQWYAHRLDFILVMTVNPGFGGQELIPETIDKITLLHKQYPNTPICVDGGVTSKNIAKLAKAGANQFVAGSAIFKSSNYQNAITQLRQGLLDK